MASTISASRTAVSPAIYEVVAKAVRVWSYPILDAKANTASIWVPPASTTRDVSEAACSMPHTCSIIGSATLAATETGSSMPSLSRAALATLSFRDMGLSGMLELTRPGRLSPLRVARAVVVPPGMDSPITRQSHSEASLPPVRRPDSMACCASDAVIAGPCSMLPPGDSPASMWGVWGRTGHPAFMAMHDMPDDSRAARVRTAGVGLPSGVVGIASMQRQRPYSMYSASAGGVYLILSGPAPATVMPGISAVCVYESTSEKSVRPSLMDSSMGMARESALPYIMMRPACPENRPRFWAGTPDWS